MAFFGFIPSQQLLATIQAAIAKQDSEELLYPYRDKIALMINDEIIDAVLTQLVSNFPASEKRDHAEKLASHIKSTVALLLKQLFAKSSNATVKKSIVFSRQSLFDDATGQIRIGTALTPELVSGLKAIFNSIKAGQDIDQSQLINLYKQFADATIQHFMTEFNHTLDLGLIKRKASDLGVIAVSKATHIAIDRIFPHLSTEELRALAQYHDTLFYQN